MSSIALKKTYLKTQLLAYGIRVFEEGNYGTIALRISDRIAPNGVDHRYSYLLSGVHNTSGRFPGVDAWHIAIRGIAASLWLGKKGRFKIPIRDKHIAVEINGVLAPILKESIRSYAEYSKEARQRQYEYRNADELLPGVDDFLGGDMSDRDKVTFVRDGLKRKLLASDFLIGLALQTSKQRFGESAALDQEILAALVPDDQLPAIGSNRLGFDADSLVAGIKTILLGSGNLWEALRAESEAA